MAGPQGPAIFVAGLEVARSAHRATLHGVVSRTYFAWGRSASFGSGAHAALHAASVPMPVLGFSRGRSILRPAPPQREDVMPDSVYKVIELVGTSKESWEK